MPHYYKDKTGDTIYSGLVLPEHKSLIKKFSGYGAYHQHIMDNDIGAPVSGFLTSLSDSLLAAGTSLDPNLLLSSAGTTIAIPADYHK